MNLPIASLLYHRCGPTRLHRGRLGGNLLATLLLASTPLLAQLKPSPAEMGDATRWGAAKLQGQVPARDLAGSLQVLANNDPVQFNARAGKPLRIAQTEYHRGLYCHAVSKVVVRLPGPGAKFQAVAGVDSNDQTGGGRGSVHFLVVVGGTERFKSSLLHEGMPGVPVEVDLAGAAEFELQVDDGGDGIGCDQADWAEAKVKLKDGREIWVADLSQTNRPITVEPPFSFTLGGQPVRELLKNWGVTRSNREADDQRIERVTTYRDDQTGLQVRCVGVTYRDFPTLEWTVYIKNEGTNDSPLIEHLQALDTHWERDGEKEFTLHHALGTFVAAKDFEPLSTPLSGKRTERFAPSGGGPCAKVWPYFNLEYGKTAGVILAVGWPGQWAASFARDDGAGLDVTAGQETTRFRLHPGEEVRTPLMVLQFWRGDWLRAQNLWRRWFVLHNMPRPEGKPPPPLLTPCSSHQFGEMINADEASQKLFIDRYQEEKFGIDYWWMDAGWYVHHGGGWPRVGTWLVDSNRFPHGLRAITDHGHSKGVKSLVWFEPERVTSGTQLYEQHPDWLLGKGAGTKLLNLGTPAARAWLTEHVDQLLNEQGIDLYRQDFNMDPLDCWRSGDTEDRQGITENHYVAGYLAYWDELLRRHPGMLIDSCASGGHRNDLETMRRSLPFLRSDYIFDPVGNQCHSYGLAYWLPYNGTGSGPRQFTPYELRSNMSCPKQTPCWDLRDRSLPYDALRKAVTDWRSYAEDYLGDFYPLTPYSLEEDVWMAWQFDRPDERHGVVQAFRRRNSIYVTAQVRLQGLDPKQRYQLKNLDAPENPQEVTGEELMKTGLSLSVPEQPGAAIYVYQALPAAK